MAFEEVEATVLPTLFRSRTVIVIAFPADAEDAAATYAEAAHLAPAVVDATAGVYSSE